LWLLFNMFYGVRVAWQLGEECVEWAVAAVHKCFLYDTLGFMTKERFEAVLTPLVKLIEDSYVSFFFPFPPLLPSVGFPSLLSILVMRVSCSRRA